MFYHWFPPHLQGLLTASGIAELYNDQTDPAYRAWAEAMATYAAQGVVQGTHASDAVGFWLVVRLPKENFSERLDFHEKIPMLVPTEGNGILIGVARTAEELKDMVECLNDKYVYLTYKIRVEGQQGWRTLLELLGQHNMIERDIG